MSCVRRHVFSQHRIVNHNTLLLLLLSLLLLLVGVGVAWSWWGVVHTGLVHGTGNCVGCRDGALLVAAAASWRRMGQNRGFGDAVQV